ncbi:MAG TPA: hypothetical protein VGG74_09060 [Kofleriaceae bacterium]|jgi:hypothetical protein
MIGARLATALVCIPALAFAAPPKLVRVAADKEPLSFLAPVGWEIQIEPVREKSMSVVVAFDRNPGTPPSCGDTDLDAPITIAIDHLNATPEALLEDQYPGKKPKKLHGWQCVVLSDDVLCAGKLVGLDAVVSVSFFFSDVAPYNRLDPPELVSRIAASLAWHGTLDDLHNWHRAGTAEACK